MADASGANSFAPVNLLFARTGGQKHDSKASTTDSNQSQGQNNKSPQQVRPYLRPYKVEVLSSENTWNSTSAEDVEPGQIFKIESGGFVPADAVVLNSASPEVYVQTPQFDGNKALRVKTAFRSQSLKTAFNKLGNGPKANVPTTAPSASPPPLSTPLAISASGGVIGVGATNPLAQECRRLMGLNINSQQQQSLATMKAMGFREYSSRKALEQSGWNTELAVAYAAANVADLDMLEMTAVSLESAFLTESKLMAQPSPSPPPSSSSGNASATATTTKGDLKSLLKSLQSDVRLFNITNTPSKKIEETGVMADEHSVSVDNVVASHSRLILTEWIVALAVFTKDKTKERRFGIQ